MPELPASPRADDGRVDPRLAAACTRADRVAALLHARVFAAVGAAATEDRVTSAGLRSDSRAELAVMLLEVDGERALPVFSSTEALQGWRRDARPVALTGLQACRAALDEGAVAVVLDPGAQDPLAIEDAELQRLADGWVLQHGTGGVVARPAEPATRVPARAGWFRRRR